MRKDGRLQSLSVYICGAKGKDLRVLWVTGQINPFCSRRGPHVEHWSLPSWTGMLSLVLAKQANLWGGPDFPKARSWSGQTQGLFFWT